MSKTTFSGPVSAGTIKDGAKGTNNLGTMLLAQKVFVVTPALLTTTTDADGQTTSTYLGQPAVAWAATAAAATISVQLPANAAIHDFVIDQSLVTTGGTAINLTAGVSAAGVEYIASTDIKATVRLIPTYTAAHLIAMRNISTNTSVFVQITPTATAVTAGVVSVTVLYSQV
jgi:hypothetical protein